MKSLTLILTERCNLGCVYCFSKILRPSSMPWRTLRSAADLLIESTRDEGELRFSGGEPLLEKRLLQSAVAYTERNCPPTKRLKYAICTNGLLLTPAVAAFLDKHDFEVQLSFDGIPEAQNMRGAGTYAPLNSLLQRLRSDHPRLFGRVTVNITLAPAAIPFLASSVRYFLESAVERLSIVPVLTPTPDWRPDRIRELDASFSEVCRDSLRHLHRTRKVPLLLLRKSALERQSASTDRNMCGVMTAEHLSVDTDGRVYGCALATRAYRKRGSHLFDCAEKVLRAGKLGDHSFLNRHELFARKVEKESIFVRKHEKYSSYSRCSECIYIGWCSVCPLSIAYNSEDRKADRIPDFACAFNRTYLKYRDGFPCARSPLQELLCGPGLPFE